MLDLERKKEEVVAHTNESRNQTSSDDREDDLEEDFEEFLDWREKKSFKK